MSEHHDGQEALRRLTEALESGDYEKVKVKIKTRDGEKFKFKDEPFASEEEETTDEEPDEAEEH